MNWKQYSLASVDYNDLQKVSLYCFLIYLAAYLARSDHLAKTVVLILFLIIASRFLYRGGERKPELPRWYVFVRFGLFSLICLALAAAKLVGVQVNDGWFAMAGCILTAGMLVAPLSAKG